MRIGKVKSDFARMRNGNVITYRIGVFEEECAVAIKALNKMDARAVRFESCCMCPSCKTKVSEKENYCHHCGQHLDWRAIRKKPKG